MLVMVPSRRPTTVHETRQFIKVMMKAILHEKKNAPHKQLFSDVEKPVPLDSQVLVKVISASINAADYRSLKMGMSPKSGAYGSAISGTVESVGKDVNLFKTGDQVLGDLSDFGFGGLAEFVVAPQKALTLKPPALSMENAAALPVAATTALKALRDAGEIQSGHNVLIVGASGGVGTYAVQLAHYYGANVVAVCSERNTGQALSLGADRVIDYIVDDFTRAQDRYDLILAINGNYSLLAYRRMLNPKGIYVMVGGSLGQIFKSIFFGWALSFGGKKMKTLSAKSDPEDLAFVAKLMAEGKIKAVIEKRYPLDQAVEAFAYMSEGHARGKVVVNVQQEM